MSNVLIKDIIFISIAIIFFVYAIVKIKLSKRATMWLFLVMALMAITKLSISVNIKLFGKLSEGRADPSFLISILILIGAGVISSFIRLVYDKIAIRYGSRFLIFKIAAVIGTLGAIGVFAGTYMGYQSAIILIAISSFAFGFIESMTGMSNVIFAEHRRFAWVSVPILIVIPHISTLLTSPIRDALSHSNEIETMKWLWLISALIGIAVFISFSCIKDKRVPPKKEFHYDLAAPKRLVFHTIFGGFAALVLSTFSSGSFTQISTYILGESRNSELFSLAWFIPLIFGSTMLCRELLKKFAPKKVVIASGVVSFIYFIPMLCFYITDTITITKLLIFTPILCMSFGLWQTIFFTSTVETQTNTGFNATKWYLSFTSFCTMLGKLFSAIIFNKYNPDVSSINYDNILIIVISVMIAISVILIAWALKSYDSINRHHKALPHIKQRYYNKIKTNISQKQL